MVVLSDAGILEAVSRGDMDLEPLDEAHLTPNGYDLAVSQVMLPDSGATWDSGTARVPPMTRFLVSTRERVRLGPGMTAQLWLRTTWARRGVLATFGRIDAGFDGTLTLAALNASQGVLELPVGETFAQLVVETLLGEADQLYAQRSGHYQDQRGVTLARHGDGGPSRGSGVEPRTDLGPASLAELRAPCLEEGCFECCLETEMPLAPEDVSRLSEAGHEPGEFSRMGGDGVRRLVNVGGRCYFLDEEGRCSVYLRRPEGCRLYPLVLRYGGGPPVLDGVCPHRSQVRWSPEHERALQLLVDRV